MNRSDVKVGDLVYRVDDIGNLARGKVAEVRRQYLVFTYPESNTWVRSVTAPICECWPTLREAKAEAMERLDMQQRQAQAAADRIKALKQKVSGIKGG